MKAKDDIQVEEIHRLFYLAGGTVRNKVARGRVKAGEIAGRIHWSNAKNPYRKVCINGREYRAHRIAWVLLYGEWPGGVVDHINHDGLLNAEWNLRDVDLSTNAKNLAEIPGVHAHWNTLFYFRIEWNKIGWRSDAKYQSQHEAEAARNDLLEKLSSSENPDAWIEQSRLKMY